MSRGHFKIFSIISVAILSGIAIHFSNPLVALIVLALWLVAAVSSFVVIIIGIFNKKFRLLYLVGFLPFLVGYGFETTIRNYKHEKAVKLNTQIERYRIEHGKYPQNLDSLNSTIKLNGLTYSVDTSFTNYRIEYLMNEFDREYYKSESKSWGTLGWND